MANLKVGVLISGRGSNMQALIRACADEDFPAEIVTVVSNNPEAAGLGIAGDAGLPTAVVDHRDFPDRESFEAALDDVLRAAQADFVCLAGFMRILTGWFVRRWYDRLINIHPSLLPAFKGLHTHERALEAGVRFTGCTVHFVRPEMDSGPIIVQAAVPVAADDTPDSLAARVLAVEHRCFPLALRLIAEGRARVAGDVVTIVDPPSTGEPLLNPREA